MKNRTCRDCIYFQHDEGVRILIDHGVEAFCDGECMRRAPVIDPAREIGFDYPYGGPRGVYPRVCTWQPACGEFRGFDYDTRRWVEGRG